MSDSWRHHGLQHSLPPLSWSLLRFMSTESVMPSNHLILCRPLLLPSFPAPGSFQMSLLFTSGGQSIGVSASASVLPMNTQDWSPSGWTGWISLQPEGLSRVFSNTTVQKHQFFRAQENGKDDCICKAEIEKKHRDTKRGEGWGESGDWDWPMYRIDTMYKIGELINNENLLIAQGTLLNPKKRGYRYTYSWFNLLCSRD